MSDYKIDRDRWATMTILDQMGNIGLEVGRAFSAKQCGDQRRLNGAMLRGMDLFDATAEGLAKQHSPRLREVLRAREQFVEAATTDKDGSWLEKYFFQFALAARRDR